MVTVGLASHWPHVTDISGSPPTGSGPRRESWAPPMLCCGTWLTLPLRMMEVVVTTGAMRHAKLQSWCHHQQTKHLVLYSPDALPVAQPTVSKHWMEEWKAWIAGAKFFTDQTPFLSQQWKQLLIQYNVDYCIDSGEQMSGRVCYNMQILNMSSKADA